ncbi:MAG: SMP-30/gluconolactonase/LRE family protein [Betaproteobacteria bacterium]|nr:SMP-30/gluconolactonase/LRE family protein [Betaproteobacteria bacterium]MDH5352708.1 SMP-30/gluconolactonase/LRE family protein [Betaproteobacteria bacterium]
MIRFKAFCLALVLGAAGTGTGWADGFGHDKVQTFATLPEGVRFPEGIAANPHNGDVFVATFDFGPNLNKLLRYDRHGRLEAVRDFGGTPMLGLAFGPKDGKVYIANFGASQIQRISAHFTAGTLTQTVVALPSIGAPANRAEGNPDGSSDTIQFGSNAFPAPNAMQFDEAGNLYVSDSFQGAIYRIASAHSCQAPCPVTTVVHSPLLATAGFPPFGANGLALSKDGTSLFVANTGDDRILRVDLATSEVTVFAESVNGADGIAFDRRGTLWVAANQSDEIVGLDAQGRIIERLGGFEGIRHGTPDGLLFPASVVIVGGDLYVTNLALPLTGAAGDEWEEDVSRWTVSRVRLPRR